MPLKFVLCSQQRSQGKIGIPYQPMSYPQCLHSLHRLSGTRTWHRLHLSNHPILQLQIILGIPVGVSLPQPKDCPILAPDISQRFLKHQPHSYKILLVAILVVVAQNSKDHHQFVDIPGTVSAVKCAKNWQYAFLLISLVKKLQPLLITDARTQMIAKGMSLIMLPWWIRRKSKNINRNINLLLDESYNRVKR